MKTILSALIVLSFLAGIAAPSSAAMAAGRDQWVPQFKSQNPYTAPKVVRNLRNDDDDNDDVGAAPDEDDEDDSNELPEWADEAF